MSGSIPITRDQYIEAGEADPLCIICGGALRMIGPLGNLMHYRCESCGADQSGGIPASARARIARSREEWERNYTAEEGG